MLDGYTKIDRDGRHALLRDDVAELLVEALLTGAGTEPGEVGGRGGVLRFSYGDGTAIIRRYLRGGVLGGVLKDGFVLGNRPLREFEVHHFAASHGLAVPPLLGVCWWRRGGLLRGAIATEALPAPHLQAWLAGAPEGAEAMAWQCGALIAEMHDAGIWHADLQLRNLLVAAEGPYLIDFDGARLRKRIGRVQRARNLLRLRRSFEKNGVDVRLYDAVLAGYGSPTPPRWLAALYAAKGRASSRLFGKK